MGNDLFKRNEKRTNSYQQLIGAKLMGHKNQKVIVSLQSKSGGNEAVSFEITKAKANKIIDLIQPEIEKKRKQIACTSITLDQFFNEETNEAIK